MSVDLILKNPDLLLIIYISHSSYQLKGLVGNVFSISPYFRKGLSSINPRENLRFLKIQLSKWKNGILKSNL